MDAAPHSARNVALFVHLSLRRGAGGDPTLPVTWSGNSASLWPGQCITLTAHYRPAAGAAPVVQINGWNVTRHSVPASAPGHTP